MVTSGVLSCGIYYRFGISIAFIVRLVDYPFDCSYGEVLGFTRISRVFKQNKMLEVFLLCMDSFGFPFNPTYGLSPLFSARFIVIHSLDVS